MEKAPLTSEASLLTVLLHWRASNPCSCFMSEYDIHFVVIRVLWSALGTRELSNVVEFWTFLDSWCAVLRCLYTRPCYNTPICMRCLFFPARVEDYISKWHFETGPDWVSHSGPVNVPASPMTWKNSPPYNQGIRWTWAFMVIMIFCVEFVSKIVCSTPLSRFAWLGGLVCSQP